MVSMSSRDFFKVVNRLLLHWHSFHNMNQQFLYFLYFISSIFPEQAKSKHLTAFLNHLQSKSNNLEAWEKKTKQKPHHPDNCKILSSALCAALFPTLSIFFLKFIATRLRIPISSMSYISPSLRKKIDHWLKTWGHKMKGRNNTWS